MLYCSNRGVEYVAVEKPAGAYTNILFSSGTTGKPMNQTASCYVDEDVGVELPSF